MASLAEMMFQSASNAVGQQTQTDSGATQAMAAGAQLVQARDRLKQQQEQLQIQKQYAEAQKLGVIANQWRKLRQLPRGAQKPFYKNVFQPAAEKMGYTLGDDFFSAATTTDVNDAQLLDALDEYEMEKRNAFQSGQFSERFYELTAQINEMLAGNPESLISISQKTSQQMSNERAQQARLTAQEMRQMQQQQFTREETEREFARLPEKLTKQKLAQDFVEYEAAGGKPVLQGNIKRLKEAIKTLESGEVSTGSITTKMPFLSTDEAQSMFNQQMLNIETDARNAIMPLLRATLGAQFTEQEGERIFGTVFDRKAPPQENARRIQNKLKELEGTLQDKESAFARFGFSKGGKDVPRRKTEMQEMPPAATDTFIDSMAMNDDIMNSDPKEMFQKIRQVPDFKDITMDQFNQMLGEARRRRDAKMGGK